MTTTRASDRPLLRIRPKLWAHLVGQLAVRGGGRRESGAFLLGRRRGRRPKVIHVAFFDDLEPASLNGAVHLTTAGYAALNEVCNQFGVEVLADIHTHPGGCTSQSSIDEDNPLVASPGHVALIVGHFARKDTSIREVACYLYDGDAGWTAPQRGLSHRRWL